MVERDLPRPRRETAALENVDKESRPSRAPPSTLLPCLHSWVAGAPAAMKLQKCAAMRFEVVVFAALASLLVLSALLSGHRTAQIDGGAHELVADSSARRPSPRKERPTSFLSSFAGNGEQRWTHNPSREMNSSTICASSRGYGGEAWPMRGPKAPPVAAATGCDIFSGRWVYDEGSHPLYSEEGCPYMSDQLACTKHGRPDRNYQSWRWQPHHCDLKRWNATEMMEKLRGKRLMFVGDSLNRGQWISMVCLLQSAIPAGKKSMSPNAALTIFKAEEYNASVEFYWAPLLVQSNSDDPVNHRLQHRIINPASLEKHAALWEQADILVFNSYLWWRSGAKIKLMWDLEEEACEEADGLQAMTLALTRWSTWVDSRVDLEKKRVFFVTMSPTHLWSREWRAGGDGNCFGETDPIEREGHWGSGSDVETAEMVRSVMSRVGEKVTVLNITQLSEYRKDGHPSIYRKFWETFSPDQLANPASYADCIHWCLPGVPDTWNELLFNLL